MTFLNQALLIGLLAVAIPIVIHLLNRRRFRRVPWAAMRFLHASVEQNRKRIKLEDLILLALRCALLALLALALARPAAEELKGLPGSKVAAVVVIDNSASMGTLEGKGTRLDLARAAAGAMLDHLPAGSSVAIATPFRPDELTADPVLARQRLAAVTQTDRHADLQTALDHAARPLEGQAAAESEIYLITDGHAEEWSAFSSLDEKIKELSTGRKVHLVLVGASVDANLGISRLTPSGSLPAVDQPFRIDVEVTNYGKTGADQVPVQLLVNDQVVGEPWVIDRIQPGRSESATVYATLPSGGTHRVTVALEADLLPFDDRRTVVLRAIDEVRILLVDGEPGVEPRDSETFFLRQALAPVAEEARASYPVKPEVISGSELAGADLGNYHGVILANVADVPLATADRLTNYVEAGGGLVIFPGPNIRTEFYNTLLHSKQGLLPASFDSIPGEDAPRPLSLVPADSNPLGFDREMLATASFRRTSGLGILGAPPSSSSGSQGSGRPVLRYDDGTPALIESEIGLGKVYLFTSTADLAWNDFARKPAYVPFVNRLLGGIIQHREAHRNLRVGEVFREPVDPALAGKEVTVYEVGDPAALGRLTTIEDRGGSSVLQFAETHRGGAYQATIEGQATPILFAARPSVRESSLDLLTATQLDHLAGSATVIRWTAGSGTNEFGAGRRGSELWLLLWFVVIALAAVELALAQWFSRSK